MRVMKGSGILILCELLVYPVLVKAVSVPLIDSMTGRDSGWEIVVSPELAKAGKVAIPYVYSVTGDAVVLELDKTFECAPDNGLFEPIVIEFLKASPRATRDIVIEDE